MSIEIVNLCKSFGNHKVLDGFSCTLTEGKTTCIMGASGIGKTTFFNLLLCLQKPDAGSISKLETLRLSAVFQEDRLCENLTPIVNVHLVTGKTVSREAIQAAFSQVGLEDSITQPVRELSGGMRRRVALVRALLIPYDVLVLDEPFKELDEETKALTIAYLKSQSAGRTVLIATHDFADAAKMDADILRIPESE